LIIYYVICKLTFINNFLCFGYVWLNSVSNTLFYTLLISLFDWFKSWWISHFGNGNQQKNECWRDYWKESVLSLPGLWFVEKRCFTNHCYPSLIFLVLCDINCLVYKRHYKHHLKKSQIRMWASAEPRQYNNHALQPKFVSNYDFHLIEDKVIDHFEIITSKKYTIPQFKK